MFLDIGSHPFESENLSTDTDVAELVGVRAQNVDHQFANELEVDPRQRFTSRWTRRLPLHSLPGPAQEAADTFAGVADHFRIEDHQ